MIENVVELVGEIYYAQTDGKPVYELPIASADTLGGIKVGSGLTIENGVLSVTGGSTDNVRETVISILIEYGLISTDGLTEEQTQALNSMTCELDTNGNLLMNYDETVLTVNFKIEESDLIVENNINSLNFNINENGELEAIY